MYWCIVEAILDSLYQNLSHARMQGECQNELQLAEGEAMPTDGQVRLPKSC